MVCGPDAGQVHSLVEHVAKGIYRNTVEVNFIVEVRTGTSTRATNFTYDLAPLHIGTLFYPKFMQMAVPGLQAVPMVNGDHVAVITLSAC
jgi:hypothetical protein